MSLVRKLSRTLGTALFTVGLGDTFDWVQSVPAGARLRYAKADEPMELREVRSHHRAVEPGAPLRGHVNQQA